MAGYQVANQKRRLPPVTLTQRCCPMLQAMLYRYFGENTVHMKRCVLKTVHASITDMVLVALNAVSIDRCRNKISCCPPRCCSSKSKFVADVHHKGPAQFPQKVSTATVVTSYLSTPLYELERSMDEMALDPPKTKNEAYWNIKQVRVVSITERLQEPRRRRSTSKSKKIGIFVIRDWVIRKSVSSSWIMGGTSCRGGTS